MKYFFQIQEQGKVWDNTPAFDLDFDNRALAVSHAKYLAKEKDREVRLTDNSKLLQGSYFFESVINRTA